MDGIELIVWLKQQEGSTRTVIMTGIGRETGAVYGGQELIDDWLLKPLALDQLQSVLSNLR